MALGGLPPFLFSTFCFCQSVALGDFASGGGEEGLNLYLRPFAGPPFYHLNYAPKESGWSPRNIT